MTTQTSNTKSEALKKNKFNIPQPKEFILTYLKDSGGNEYYYISSPIKVTSETLTAWAYNRHGVRSFNFNKIIDLKEVGDSVKV